MIYLGIIVSHNAGASLMINGEIVCAVQEERFTGIKNFSEIKAQEVTQLFMFFRIGKGENKNNFLMEKFCRII